MAAVMAGVIRPRNLLLGKRSVGGNRCMANIIPRDCEKEKILWNSEM